MTRAKSRKGIPDRIAMYAFWGFPTSVARLPTFTAIARATRWGTGFTRRARALRTTTGVTRRAIVSFRTRAERTAVTTMRPARRLAWSRERRATRAATRSKKPHASRPETRIIIPMRSRRTSTLIAARASAGPTIPRRSMRAAPSIAVAGRSRGKRAT